MKAVEKVGLKHVQSKDRCRPQHVSIIGSVVVLVVRFRLSLTTVIIIVTLYN